MALSFAEVKNILDQTIGTLQAVTVNADSTNRGASSSGTSGLLIKRNGEVTGSFTSGSITLEGGGLQWSDSLSQDNAAPYFTRAQRTMLASILNYVGSMSDATVDNQVSQR